MKNILYAYTTENESLVGVAKYILKWYGLNIDYTFHWEPQCIHIGDSKQYHHRVDRDSIWRYGGMEFVDVVFVPQEDSFDKDVVHYLKSRIRQVKDSV